MKLRSKAPNKEKLPVTAQKNWDNFLLVSTYQPFKERVAATRERLDIPETGFDTDKKVSAWHHQKAQQSDEIMNSADFQKTLQAIRIKFQKQKISRKKAEEESKKLHLLLPFNFLTYSAKELAQEFNLPESYQQTIRSYILRNTPSYIPGNSFTIGPWDAGGDSENARYVPLRIYTKLTDEDLKEIKEEVNSFFGEKLPFIQNLKEVEKRIEVERLKKEGWEYDEISREYYKLSDEEIAERVFGSTKKKSKIYESVRGLKTLRKRRFGKAGKQ